MNPLEPWLKDRVALVTGAGGGIGLALCEMLARHGAAMVVSSASSAGVEKARETAAATGADVLGVQVDVGDSAAVDAMVDAAVQRFGRVDVLVNNAGITRDNLSMRMKDDAWEHVLRVNLSGAFYCSRAVQRSMLKQKWGRIISITSVVGLTGNAGQANYAASKAGIVGLTKSLARELAGRGVTVNAIAPGFIVTRMTEALTEGQREAARARIPLGVFGEPADVAHAVVFLASDMARYITGQVLAVDGGMTM